MHLHSNFAPNVLIMIHARGRDSGCGGDVEWGAARAGFLCVYTSRPVECKQEMHRIDCCYFTRDGGRVLFVTLVAEFVQRSPRDSIVF